MYSTNKLFFAWTTLTYISKEIKGMGGLNGFRTGGVGFFVFELSEMIFRDMIDLWTQSCLA